MKSKTSLLNKTVLKKDITRFAPIWALYTVFLLLMLFEFGSYPAAITALNLLEFTRSMGIINALYAGVCVAFLFMDLFNGRLCNALHAFPLQRKNWLTNHVLAGFLFSFVPNLLATLVAIPMLWEYAHIALIWLAVTTLQFLFFFGSAVLCAMCAGNLIGMGALYGIFHLVVVLIGGIAELFYQPLLHGVKLTIDSFAVFIPLYQMEIFEYADFEVIHQKLDPYGVFNGLIGKDWLYLGLCAVVGAVCIWLAWLVYRKRNLENAGDLLAVKKLSPLFLLICTVGAGAVLYLFSGAFGARSYVFLAVGTIVGYFAGRMLLNRTIKVFTKRAFMGFGIIVAVAAASFLLTWLDPVGMTRYVPELDQIESASVTENFYNEVNSTPNENFRITDQTELAELQDYHRQLIQHRPSSENQTFSRIAIHYTLKSGRTVCRYYAVERNSDLERRAVKYFSDIRHIFNVADPQQLYNTFDVVDIESVLDSKTLNTKIVGHDQINGLIDAIKKDCEAGHMAQEFFYRFDYDADHYYLRFPVDEADYTYYKTIQVDAKCTNTVAYLKQIVNDDWQDAANQLK